ncbi:phosphatase PAP2 family protein [Labrys monachus]|uniref:Undecaprenyl-diphosphatase n=1 Tax=Labrys monachus TaxID=217067 RepID=A0ABU0FM60_9HYPH|nr:phosphatase PAP2 family protein [Labrys monachus]MDQ0395145.1 undecaprenyl-diphosphatase [Labrys monachus]
MRNAIRQWAHTATWRELGRRLREPPRFAGRPLFGRIPPPAAVLFGLLLTVALMVTADPADLRILHEWPHSLIRVAAIVTNLGDSGLYLVPLGIALIGLALVDPVLPRRADAALRQVWLRLAFCFTVIAVTGLAVNLVKRAIGRVRPLHVDPGAYLTFDPFAWHATAASMPSGHATTAWSVAACLVLLAGPRVRPYAFAFATLVCVSRVVLGAHFVSDVVAGALLGWFATLWFAQFLARRGLVFRQKPDGALALRGQDAAKTLLAWRARRKDPIADDTLSDGA